MKIENLRNGRGQLAISIFNAKSPKGFPDRPEAAVEKIVFSLEGKKEVEIETKPLSEGDYAVALLHDENSDSKFNTNFIGYPQEGFGFSNNPRIYFGPPGIEKALFHHPGSSQEIVIRVRYF